MNIFPSNEFLSRVFISLFYRNEFLDSNDENISETDNKFSTITIWHHFSALIYKEFEFRRSFTHFSKCKTQLTFMISTMLEFTLGLRGRIIRSIKLFQHNLTANYNYNIPNLLKFTQHTSVFSIIYYTILFTKTFITKWIIRAERKKCFRCVFRTCFPSWTLFLSIELNAHWMRAPCVELLPFCYKGTTELW